MSDTPRILTLARYTVLANPQRTLNLPEVEGVGELRRVGCFMAVDEERKVVAFRNDDAPDLAEEFRVFSDGECEREVLRVAPDRAGAWGVHAGETLIGRLAPAARGLRARAWQLEGPDGAGLARLDDATPMASLQRRFRRAHYRERFRIQPADGSAPTFLLRDGASNAYVLRVVSPDEPTVDRALILAAAMCLPTLEGLTAYLRPDLPRFEG
ncbi:MAG: hypothetical protein AAFZ65_04330 [Planctomycetota bacterium]